MCLLFSEYSRQKASRRKSGDAGNVSSDSDDDLNLKELQGLSDEEVEFDDDDEDEMRQAFGEDFMSAGDVGDDFGDDVDDGDGSDAGHHALLDGALDNNGSRYLQSSCLKLFAANLASQHLLHSAPV